MNSSLNHGSAKILPTAAQNFTLLGVVISARQLLMLTLFLTFVIGAPALLYPFGRDQGIHAYVGAEILNGNLPYRDVFVQKGPFGFLIHTAVTLIAGPTTWGIRLFDLIWQAVGYTFLFLIARRRLSLPISSLVVLLTSFAYHSAGFWHTAHHEGHLTPFLLFAIGSLDKQLSKKAASWLFPLLSGTAVAATFWFKQTAGLYTVALLLWLVIHAFKQKNGRTVWQFIAGNAILHLITVGLLIAFGMLLPMLEIYDYSFFVYPRLTPSKSFLEKGQLLLRWWNEYALITYPAIIGCIITLFSKKRADWLGLQIILIASLFTVYAQGKFWHYHWVTTLPFLALFSGALFEQIKGFLPKRLGFSSIILALFILSRPLQMLSMQNWQYANARLSWQTDTSSVITHWQSLSSDIPSTITALTSEKEPIFVWGHYTILYYFTERINPTSYPMDIPLIAGTKFQEKWQTNASSDLEDNPPQLILLATIDTNDFEPEPSVDQVRYFPPFEKMLADEYIFDFHLSEFQVYSPKSILLDRLDHQFGENILLKDVIIRRALLEPNGEIIVSLHWQATQQMMTDYVVFVQLVDWSKPEVIAQNDSQPAWGQAPTSQWQVDESVLDTHILSLPESLQPGTYELIFGLYDPATGTRLSINNQNTDYFVIQTVHAK